MLKTAKTRQAVDLRTSQAVKIERGAAEKPVDIEVAKDRFIRNFDEPKRRYARSVKQLSPVAYYRMPIRDKGPGCRTASVLRRSLDGRRRSSASCTWSICGRFAASQGQFDRTRRAGGSPPSIGTGISRSPLFVYLESADAEWHGGNEYLRG